MARHAVAGLSTVVGTTLRAMMSVFAVAATGFNLRQISVVNTTTTSLHVALVRFTNATGVGAGLTEVPYDQAKPGVCTGFAGHTGDGAVGSPFGYITLGAAIGAGYVWTFGESGLMVPVGTANGVGIICPSGTGQLCTCEIHWDE